MIPLTKREEKLICSLQQKKYRKQEGLFLVEGEKMVHEAILSSYGIEYIVASIPFSAKNILIKKCDQTIMKKISSFKNPPGIIAVVKIPDSKLDFTYNSGVNLMIDKVQDPGNLGTIIRTAEALGVKRIICSEETVDFLSPKVVQATMGSLFRMQIENQDLFLFLKNKNDQFPVYAAHLEGNNIYSEKILSPSYLIVSNESNGLSDFLLPLVTKKIKIPIIGDAESFNVSIATAIILSEFCRRGEEIKQI